MAEKETKEIKQATEHMQDELKKIQQENEKLKKDLNKAEQRAEAAEAARIDAELLAAEKRAEEEKESKAKADEKEADLTAGQKQVQLEKRMQLAMEEAKADTVTIRLPILPNAEDNDVFVGVNGYKYLIQRGKDVEVPRFVAEVLNNSENQKAETYRMLEAMQRRAETGKQEQFL